MIVGCQTNFNNTSFTATPEMTSTATLLPSTPTMTLTPTELPIEAMNAEQLLEKYLALDGQLDTSVFTNEQRIGFSEALAEYKNKQRGANPAVYNGEAYLDPDSYKMRKINDGRTKQEQTIQIFLPVSHDTGGNLRVKLKEEWITIADSKATDWNIMVSDKDDPRINFPNTKLSPDGLPHIQTLLSRNDKEEYKERGQLAFVPIILFDKNFGGIFLEGKYPQTYSSFRIATIETDNSGNPIVARLSIIIWEPRLYLFEEGTEIDLFSDSLREGINIYLENPANKEVIEFWENLEENQTYYMGLYENQSFLFEHSIFASLNGWTGLAPLEQSGQILTHQIKNDKDLLLLKVGTFLKRSE